MQDPEEAAEELRRQHDGGIPVNVHRLAQACGLTVTPQELEDEVSGMLIIQDGAGTIGVNQTHPKNRQRFSIAHELGHWRLHSTTSSVFLDTTSVFFRDRESAEGVSMQEIEANKFAAALLMPGQALRDAVGSGPLDPFDELTFRRLAARFSVSVQALGIRLARLDLVAL
jgi:Zn-dependent peptidase ImmA (M78 family)